MVFIVIALLAAAVCTIRPIADVLHTMKGAEPPHLAKAKLRATTQTQKLAAKQAATENRNVRPGEDKPGLADVIRVYWGDAMADAIDAHNRRRAEKKAHQTGTPQTVPGSTEVVASRPSLIDRTKRFARLLW